jgi:pimeloyl-ACP methyl ester carboxylesterase
MELEHELIDNHKSKWVVFIHGMGGSTRTWKRQIEAFSKHFNLLLLDLPGHGSNASHEVTEVDSVELNYRIKKTLDSVGVKAAHFVGLSLGSIVVARFALAYPEYVLGIVLAGAILNLTNIYRFIMKGLDVVKRLLPYKAMYRFFAWFMLPKKNHKKSRMIFLREAIKLKRESMLAWIQYAANQNYLGSMVDKLRGIGRKTLFISGNEDHCFIKGIRNLMSKLPGAKIKEINECGHICSIEHATEFNDAAIEYLLAA